MSNPHSGVVAGLELLSVEESAVGAAQIVEVPARRRLAIFRECLVLKNRMMPGFIKYVFLVYPRFTSSIVTRDSTLSLTQSSSCFTFLLLHTEFLLAVLIEMSMQS